MSACFTESAHMRLSLSRDEIVRNIASNLWYIASNDNSSMTRSPCYLDMITHSMRRALEVMSVRDMEALRNEKGEGLLHVAIFNCNAALVNALLAVGVNANLPTLHGDLPLMLALDYDAMGLDTPHVVVSLIEHGADVNAGGAWGNTPLFLAVMACGSGNRLVDVVRMLLARGANVNSGATEGRTPLHAAVYNCNIELVNLLLLHGANVTVCAVAHMSEQENWGVWEWSGLTPLGLARTKALEPNSDVDSNAYTSIIEALVDAGSVE